MFAQEVDIYIENIIAKFGAFNYAELKTPFNPYNELQHLVDMIPGTRSGRPRRRSTAYKSDLRLCIVKTADNHLSIVKKCSDRSPMTSKVIDLVDENSSTPPPHASTSSGKKRSSETKSKSNKLSPRNASNTAAVAAAAAAAAAATANEENESRHKTYQVLRRKSMAVEREQHKKVSAVILKRKSISVARAHELDSSLKLNDDDDVSVEIVPTKRSKSTAAIGKKDKSVVADVEIIPKTSSSKKQKRSHEHATTTPAANDPNATNASNTSATVTAAMVTTTANVTNATNATNVTNATSDQTENDQNVSQKADTETEKSETVDEAEPKEVGSESILTSVGLSRVVRKSKDEIEESIASSAIDEKTEDDAGTKCATVDEHNLGLRLSKETIEVDAEPPVPDKMSHRKSVSGKSPKIALVPFIELKEEPKDDDITDAVPKDGETDVTPETNEVSAIKTERALLDDSVMIIDEDPAPKSSPPASVSRLIENIRRGAIAVRDIEKMTNRPSKSPAKSATEAQRARKTFPRGLQLPAAMSNGVTSRGRTQSSSKRLPAMNNMVYIPLDGNSFSRSEVMPSISGPKLTSQPPPLTIVGSTPPTVSSSNITNLCINGPPPLSVAGASLLINQGMLTEVATPSLQFIHNHIDFNSFYFFMYSSNGWPGSSANSSNVFNTTTGGSDTTTSSTATATAPTTTAATATTCLFTGRGQFASIFIDFQRNADGAIGIGRDRDDYSCATQIDVATHGAVALRRRHTLSKRSRLRVSNTHGECAPNDRLLPIGDRGYAQRYCQHDKSRSENQITRDGIGKDEIRPCQGDRGSEGEYRHTAERDEEEHGKGAHANNQRNAQTVRNGAHSLD